MISKLFKPAWEHKDPDRRVAAIASFSEDNSDQQNILEKIAQSDADKKVREAAISQLISLRALEMLRQSESGEVAQARLSQLIGSKEESHQALVLSFVSSAEPETLLDILGNCPNSEARSAALESVKDQQSLAQIASDSEFADTREAAAQQVDQLDLLEPLWKKVRERDKNLAKNLHERIEALQQVERRKAEVAEQAGVIVESITELKASTWTPQYNLKFLALVNQWQEVESEVEADLADKYRELAIGVEAVVLEHRKVLELMEQQQELLTDAEQLMSDAQALSFEELDVQMERWVMLRRIWLDSLSVTIPEEALGQRFDQVGAYFVALERIIANKEPFVSAEPVVEEQSEQEPDQEQEASLELTPEPAEPEADAETQDEAEGTDAEKPEAEAAESEEAEAEAKAEPAEPELADADLAEPEPTEPEVSETEAEEPLADQEPSADKEPSAPTSEEEPSADQASAADKAPSADKAPAADKDPAVDHKAQIASMKAAIKTISWPTGLQEPEALLGLKNQLREQEAALKEQMAEAKQQVESLSKQIGRLNGATRRGDLKMARGVYKKIETRFARMAEDQQSKMQEQWDKAEKSFKEMLDWKEFAIQPKFVELCEAMETLASSADAKNTPQKQAEEIKKLQANWKKLEALAPDEVWKRFQQAGDKAFEPCAAFYAELDVLRAENLEKRKQVVEKLRGIAALPESEEWQESPDWKSLRNNLREIREEWRKYAEVDQQKCRKLGKKYADLAKKLEKHIKTECQANLASKKQLVERAVAMSTQDAAAISLDQLKELQGSWKHIGIVDRRDDQKLWKAFKEACDAVFAKHREKIDESRAEEKAQADVAKKIIQSIRGLAKTEAGATPDGAKLKELQDEYRELPRLHESIQKNLDRDLYKAIESVESAVKKHKREKETQFFVEMQRRAEICASLEALDTDKDAAKAEKLLAKWEEHSLPADASQLMEQRKEAALAAKFGKAETDAAERARRLICIELEALLGKTTPSEDQALKMEYQLEQMKSKGLGANTTQDARAATEEARKNWYGSPAAAKKAQKELDERFHKLI